MTSAAGARVVHDGNGLRWQLCFALAAAALFSFESWILGPDSWIYAYGEGIETLPAHLALSFVHTPGARLVLVASLPPGPGELLPHQTSSEGWLIRTGSPHPLGFVLAR